MAKVYTSADQLIGKTPLLELTHIEKAYGLKAKVLAKKGFSMVGYTQMDLGIAKLHFEIGAGTENFEWE